MINLDSVIRRKAEMNDLRPIVLVGPTACGKTILTNEVARRLKIWPYGNDKVGAVHGIYEIDPWHINLSHPEDRARLMYKICDFVTKGVVLIISITDQELAKQISQSFGLNAYYYDDLVGPDFLSQRRTQRSYQERIKPWAEVVKKGK